MNKNVAFPIFLRASIIEELSPLNFLIACIFFS